MKLLGCQPAIFDGDRTRADDFIEEVKGYFRVNAQVPDMQSWLRKIAFTLTLIKGPLVANWVQTMGEWFDTLQPHNDMHGTWQTFLDNFRREYQDTQSEERARIAIENLKMKWPLVDPYKTSSTPPSRQDTRSETQPPPDTSSRASPEA
jgi:hypothetical protein